jgi:hypothetical protein
MLWGFQSLYVVYYGEDVPLMMPNEDKRAFEMLRLLITKGVAEFGIEL